MTSPITELLPKDYGFVVLSVVLYFFLNFWMAYKVLQARTRYNVPYPALYASEAENKNANIFNCVQRGHQNSLEMMPLFFVVLILGGLMYPKISASLALFYIFTRYFYFKGYATGVPKNRGTIGRYNVLSILGLMICTASLGVHLLLA